MGPTFGIDVSSSPAYVRDAAQDNRAAVASCLGVGSGSRICVPEKSPVDDASSSSSSSIGAPDDSDDDEDVEDDASFKGSAGDDDEAQSRSRGGSFGSLASLEESLPIKRGLSNHFPGKSRSFANLSEVGTVKDLEKRENPLNKRRRVLIASKWSRKSFYSWANPKSMPLLTLKEDEENDEAPEEENPEREEEKENHGEAESCRLLKIHEKMRLRSFKARSCLSLADLQHHNRLLDEEDGDYKEEEEEEDHY